MEAGEWIAVALATGVAGLGAGHALLFKRDSRAALGWIAVCLFFPVAGSALYFLFGINRTRTRARELRDGSGSWLDVDYESGEAPVRAVASNVTVSPELADLVRVSDAVAGRPLVGGNTVAVLHNGEEAFPAMLGAIDRARRSVFLATYIFETNETGQRFIQALAAATARGVDVRVLIDGIGERYSFPTASRHLRRHGVRVARFLPPRLFPPALHVNLRNHRKILVADGAVGFTGGMNIGDRHLAARTDDPARVIDAHFRLTGPIVTEMEELFLEDWSFATGEPVRAPASPAPPADGVLCRAVADGPNEDLDRLSILLAGVASTARRRIWIMTPYFLPPRELLVAMQVAALRGVEVAVILPEKNNLPYVHWATRNMLWELLRWNVRVYYQPAPFVHTKLFLVDGHYTQVGSANIDPRSLRLNFELAIEVFDHAFVETLERHFATIRSQSREVSLREVVERPLLVRTRDALAWLFSPYL